VSILGAGAGGGGLRYLLALSCLYVSAEAVVDGLDAAGYAVSSGSSCVADTRRPSHVLEAMGALTQGNLRLTLPLGSTAATVEGFAEALAAVIAADREALGAPEIA
jgi:cysteine desulfurase